MIPFNTVDEGFAWIEELTNFEKKPPAQVREYRLDRMKILFSLFDNPHLAIPSVHIAGSKGKGSCAYMISQILTESGKRCGTYTSPHVTHYRERFMVNMGYIRDELILEGINDIYAKVKTAALPFHGLPTTFEILTLLAFILFERNNCEINVIETGLGGRLDATNLLMPDLSIITSIELEHSNILGDTLSKIAQEKGGIIKNGVPVISSGQHPEAAAVLEEISRKRNSPIISITDYFSSGEDGTFTMNLESGEYMFKQPNNLPGRAQMENTAVSVYAALRVLEYTFKEKRITSFFPQVQQALDRVSIPGRFERFKTGTIEIIIDGAHTVYSLRNLTESIQLLYGNKGLCLFGMVEGKDLKGSTACILETFKTICITTPGNFKKSNIDEIYANFREAAGKDHTVIIEKDSEAAFDVLLSKNPELLCVAGSFYLAGIIKSICVKRGYSHAY